MNPLFLNFKFLILSLKTFLFFNEFQLKKNNQKKVFLKRKKTIIFLYSVFFFSWFNDKNIMGKLS